MVLRALLSGEIAGNAVRAGGDRATAVQRQDSHGMQRGEEYNIPYSRVHAQRKDPISFKCLASRRDCSHDRPVGEASAHTVGGGRVGNVDFDSPEYTEKYPPKPYLAGGNDVVRCGSWVSA